MAVRDRRPAGRRTLVAASVAVASLTVASLWMAFAFLSPTPPHTIAMATDPEGSDSAELGKRYREILARDGIDLRLSPSAGAVENAARLRDPQSGIGIAIIPGGITTGQESPGLVSLGTLFYEPLWLFYHGPRRAEKHESFRGLRIAIGPEGSGAHALSLELLARIDIIDRRSAELLPLAPQAAAEKLLRGEIDAAVMLSSWESPVVRRLLAAGNVNLANVTRADAYVALYPYLNKVVVPAGVGDMVKNRPPANVVLLAPKASLVVRRDLHPAIQHLLLEAAVQIHSGPGMFRAAGQFPAPESIDLPLSDNASQFYKTGQPFLQRVLPFWLAMLAQQLLVLLIPVVGLLYPLLRLLPALYGWAMRSRVFRLYGELKFLEEELASRGARDVADLVARLDRLEDRASRFRLPVAFRPLLYTLRLHIDLVRQRLRKS